MRPQAAHNLPNVARVQAAGQEDLPLGQERRRQVEIPGLAGTAPLVSRPGVKQHRIGPAAGVGEPAVADFERLDDRAAGGEARSFGPVQLHVIQADQVGDAVDLLRGLVDEDADQQRQARQPLEDPERCLRLDAAQARAEVEPEQIRPRVDRRPAPVHIADSADLDERHFSDSSLISAPGSDARRSASPTRTASTPASLSLRAVAASLIPLSATTPRSPGIRGRSRSDRSRSTWSVFRSRWLMPIRRVPESSPAASSASSWTSTRASIPSEWTSRTSCRSRTAATSAWVSRTISARTEPACAMRPLPGWLSPTAGAPPPLDRSRSPRRPARSRP